MQRPVFSVSEFLGLVNQNLEQAFPLARVEGEISGYGIAQNKWVSFSLKDENEEALLSCWGTVWQIKEPFEDGMRVVVEGRPQVRPQSGRFSLRVERITPTGEGALKRAFELLRAKLEAEGLFEPARKRTLPAYPQRVGLITAARSQAYQDFVKIINDRWAGAEVHVAPVQVQGGPAVAQIVAAVDYFNQLAKPVQVLAIVRGGGSLEDLAAFNSEAVARAVALSRTPTVVGVGHEGDVTLADLAADVRAATPTDAAKRIAPDKVAVRENIESLGLRLETELRHHLTNQQGWLNRQVLQLHRFIDIPLRQVSRAEERLGKNFIRYQQGIASQSQAVGSLIHSLEQLNLSHWRSWVDKLGALTRTLRQTDPRLLLRRGYAIARTSNGKIVRASRDVNLGEELMLQLAKGSLAAEVKRINNG